MGELSLRRRRDPVAAVEVYEVKLGEEFLMSSLFTAAEIELTRLGLAAVRGEALRVLVGGLGLGYTAREALRDPRVAEVTVIEALSPVIDWHRRRLLPESAALVDDERTRLTHGDFFDVVGRPEEEGQSRRYDAVLLDVDHSPRHLLHPDHAAFYTSEGLRRLANRLNPGGVFALWSNDAPDEDFLELLRETFVRVEAAVVEFPNPLQDRAASNTVYTAVAASG